MAKRRVKSQIVNLTPDQKKSKIDSIYLAVDDVPHTFEKILTRSTTLLQTAFRSEVRSQSYGLQSHGSPGWRDFGTPIRKSRERKAIWTWALWRGPEYTIRGKVVASPKFEP